jgi:hypothetical protein
MLTRTIVRAGAEKTSGGGGAPSATYKNGTRRNSRDARLEKLGEQHRQTNTHLFVPTVFDVDERGLVIDGKAQQKYIGLRVAQRADTRIAFLACCIPEGELYVLAVDHDFRFVVLCGYRGEGGERERENRMMHEEMRHERGSEKNLDSTFPQAQHHLRTEQKHGDTYQRQSTAECGISISNQ